MGAATDRSARIVVAAASFVMTLAAGAVVLHRFRPHPALLGPASPIAVSDRSSDGGPKDVPDGNPMDAGATETGAELPSWTPASPAASYGSLEGAACDKALGDRGIGFTAARGTLRVDRPIRMLGPLHGVAFRGAGLANRRGESVFDVADCRLVLALDDLAAMLARRGVVAVDHFSMHRPGAAPVATPPARRGAKPAPSKPAPSKPAPSKPSPVPSSKPSSTRHSQHELGLAIDIGAFVKADGSRLEVKTSWQADIGAPPCGAGSAPRVPTPEAIELRAIVCEVARSGLFNVVLTPNANAAHFDHVHLDITQGAKWFIVE